jgi:hypothetical protein
MRDRALLLPLSLLFVTSCASYQAQPLASPAEVGHARELPAGPLNVAPDAAPRQPRARASLQVNLADGLDADEGAVLAVLLNPELIALRSTRGTSEAQVLEAEKMDPDRRPPRS